MSAQSRYKTLIPSLVNLYVAPDTLSRTTALRDGLLALAESGDWNLIKKDADRLLTVWASKESDPAASAIVGEIDNILAEFIETTAPTLVITDKVEPIQHVLPPVSHPPASHPPVSHPPVSQRQTQPPVTLCTKPPFMSTPVFVEPDEEDEVEVEDEEEVEEEEEGMEVEKRKIRGVNYWFEEKTNKLYAIVGDDDVGDEVGILLANGKPVMLVPA